MISKSHISSKATTTYARPIPTASASRPKTSGRIKMAVPDARVARALAWMVCVPAEAMANDRVNGYMLATPRPVRNNPTRVGMAEGLFQNTKKPNPASRIKAVTRRPVEKYCTNLLPAQRPMIIAARKRLTARTASVRASLMTVSRKSALHEIIQNSTATARTMAIQ